MCLFDIASHGISTSYFVNPTYIRCRQRKVDTQSTVKKGRQKESRKSKQNLDTAVTITKRLARAFRMLGNTWAFSMLGNTWAFRMLGNTWPFRMLGNTWAFMMLENTWAFRMLGNTWPFRMLENTWAFMMLENTWAFRMLGNTWAFRKTGRQARVFTRIRDH
jgi:ribosome-associated toxin RatA of RatAB toxin-antitoxin module